MFAPTASEIREYINREDPESPYLALASMCDQNQQVVWKHIVDLCEEVYRQMRGGNEVDTSDTCPLILMSSVISRFMVNDKENATNVERRKLASDHAAAQSKPRLFVHEYVWFMIGHARHSLATPPRPTLAERRAWFLHSVSKLLLPSRWWDHVTTSTEQEERARNKLACAYCCDLINEITNPGGGLWDSVTLRTIAVCERVFSGFQFLRAIIPISTYPPSPDGNSMHTHAAGKFVAPRHANNPAKRRAIRDRIDEYVRTSQHAMLGQRVAELGTARHVMFGEFAAFERESPNDARVYKARTTLKRCQYQENYRNEIMEIAVCAESEQLSGEKFKRWRDTIDLCVYSMMFTEMVPPVRTASRGAGRTGVSDYIDAFCCEYVINWYDWMSVPHMLRMLISTRNDRCALPMIFDIGKGFLLRDGPAHSICTELVSGTSRCDRPNQRRSSCTTEWVYLPSAMDALIEWEFRASTYHGGYLERVTPIPMIARCDADIPEGDEMDMIVREFAPEPEFMNVAPPRDDAE